MFSAWSRPGSGYDKSMSTTKVAVTMASDVLAAAKQAVKRGRAKSLSSFVSDAVGEKVQRDELLTVLDQMDAHYGNPSKADRAWAKRILSR